MDSWALPGPAHFLANAIENLREGQNLVLACPSRSLPGLCNALDGRLHEQGWAVRGPLSDDASDPLDQIFVALDLDEGGAANRSVAALCRRLNPGCVVVIDGVGRESWLRWNRLLQEYEVASRSVSSFDRPRLVVAVQGVPLADLPTRAAALTVMPWQDVVGELDVLLYVRNHMRCKGAMDRSSGLIARMIAKLALWDFDFVEFLLDQDRDALFDPLKLMAGNPNSHSLGVGPEFTDSWESGGRLKFDGIELTHSLLVHLDPTRREELNMRLWEAHAGEILPLLERHRRALAIRMRKFVSTPIQLGEQRFSNLDDLELGQLAYIARKQGLNQGIRDAAEKWRLLRNKLAHLEALDFNEVLDPQLWNPG